MKMSRTTKDLLENIEDDLKASIQIDAKKHRVYVI